MTYGYALTSLADPTRRSIFERLRSGRLIIGAVALNIRVRRPAVSQHLTVLKEAGPVNEPPDGPRRIYYIDPEGFGPWRAWIDQFWDQALAAFQDEIEHTKPTEGGNDP